MSYNLTKEALKEVLEDMGINRTGLLDVCVDPSERVYNKLFWRDDMENYTVCKWNTFYVGSVPAYVNIIEAYEGNYVLQITNPGGATAPVAQATFGMLSHKKHAIEIKWLMNRNTIERLIIGFFNGSYQSTGEAIGYGAEIYYSEINNRWEYYSRATNERKPITGAEDYIGGDATNPAWNYLKIVSDFENNILSRLVTNRLDLDLSAIPLNRYDDNARRGVFRFYIGAYVQNVGNPVYFDDARIYLNLE